MTWGMLWCYYNYYTSPSVAICSSQATCTVMKHSCTWPSNLVTVMMRWQLNMQVIVTVVPLRTMHKWTIRQHFHKLSFCCSQGKQFPFKHLLSKTNCYLLSTIVNNYSSNILPKKLFSLAELACHITNYLPCHVGYRTLFSFLEHSYQSWLSLLSYLKLQELCDPNL